MKQLLSSLSCLLPLLACTDEVVPAPDGSEVVEEVAEET